MPDRQAETRPQQAGSSPRATAAVKVVVALAAAGAVAAFAYHAWALFYKYPPVWPDESLFADPAISLARHGTTRTGLLAGIVPGIDRRTYWMPPGYTLFLCGVFRLAQPGVTAMRLSSLATAALVLILTWLLGRRAGVGKWASLAAVALMAADVVFLRGALVGRMDLAALAFVVLTLWLMTSRPGAAGGPSAIRLVLVGAAGAGAILMHPVGVVALLSALASLMIFPPTPRRKALVAVSGGAAVVLLAWGVYILQDPGSFLAQFGAQFARKAARQPMKVSVILHSGGMALNQYGIPLAAVLLAWVGGLVGLFAAAVRRRDLLVLPICQVLTFAVIIYSKEMWYPVYAVPLTCLGLLELVGLARRRAPARLAVAAAAVCACLLFAAGNFRRALLLNHDLNTVRRGATDYFAWCGRLGEALPKGSTVLLCVIPDPYLGLLDRRDVTFRHFVPVGIPVDPEHYRQWMAEADYVILGDRTVDEAAERFVEARAVQTAEVGSAQGYHARIYRVSRPAANTGDD